MPNIQILASWAGLSSFADRPCTVAITTGAGLPYWDLLKNVATAGTKNSREFATAPRPDRRKHGQRPEPVAVENIRQTRGAGGLPTALCGCR